MASFSGTIKARDKDKLIKKVQDNPINIRLSKFDLMLYLKYTMCKNTKVRMTHLHNLQTFINRITLDSYINHIDQNGNSTNKEEDDECIERIEHLRRVLKARVNDKLTDPLLVMQSANGGIGQTSKFDNEVINIEEISDMEVEWISNSISQSLKFNFIYNYAPNMISTLEAFLSSKGPEREGIAEKLERAIDDIKQDFRKTANESYNEIGFDLNPEGFEDRMREVYNREVSPSRRLKSGMQGLNKMVGGGFESGRVYMLFGTAAAGKSFTLLDLMIQIKKYNTDYVCHDKTKIPCVVLLTMENSVQETVTRLYSMISGNRMRDKTFEEVMDDFINKGHLTIDDGTPINIKVEYKPNLSVDTRYLYTLYDNLQDQGYEPIAFFQDHIKRIKPVEGYRDARLDLGEIVNEFKAFAVEKDIPFFSDSHLNRDASKILEDAKRANKQDLARLLGRSNVSESMLMIDNCDVGLIITKDRDRLENVYLGVLLIRTRTESELEYFAQPFVPGNHIKLVEDINEKFPSYKLSLHDPNNITNKMRSDYDDDFPINDDDELFNEKTIPEYGKPQDVDITELMNKNVQIPIGIPSTPVYNNFDQNIRPDGYYCILGTTYPESKLIDVFNPGNLCGIMTNYEMTNGSSCIQFIDDSGEMIVDGVGRIIINKE